MLSREDFALEVEQKSTMLYRVAYTILQNDENVKDALQSALLTAWAKLYTLRDSSIFSTWITRILINECYSFKRRIRKELQKNNMNKLWILNHINPDLIRLNIFGFYRFCSSYFCEAPKYVLQNNVEEMHSSSFQTSDSTSEVQLVLDTLPEKLKLPIVLHYLEGYSYQEISQMLRVPQSTVRSRLSRAREAMRIEIVEGACK